MRCSVLRQTLSKSCDRLILNDEVSKLKTSLSDRNTSWFVILNRNFLMPEVVNAILVIMKSCTDEC